MRILIDTHVFLWAHHNPRRIPDQSRELLLDPAHEVLVSIASAWEIGIKKGLGKMVFPRNIEDVVRDAGFGFLPITPEHCRAVCDLPFFDDHRDPFDRMLVVQAKLDGCHLMSRDAKLDRYGIRRIW